MPNNPTLKPKVATSALTVASAVTIVVVLMLAALTATFPAIFWFMLIVVAIGLVLLYLWGLRIRRQRRWRAKTDERWSRLESLKDAGPTTTEVTVLSVDAPQPTGAWITIRWNRFDYIQPAWIEALPEQIWPGSVLLIRPDPAQVRPGAPWPATYFLSSDQVLAWAPLV